MQRVYMWPILIPTHLRRKLQKHSAFLIVKFENDIKPLHEKRPIKSASLHDKRSPHREAELVIQVPRTSAFAVGDIRMEYKAELHKGSRSQVERYEGRGYIKAKEAS